MADLADQEVVLKQTELCTIDDKTYIAAESADGVQLLEQTTEGTKAVIGANYTADEIRKIKKQVKAATPAVETINAQVRAKIRERYSIEDEIKMLRLAPSPETAAWNDYVEECRQWGRAEKAKLGL